MRAIDYFDKSADAHPDRVAIVDGETTFTYRQTRLASQQIARAMWAHGLQGEQCAAIFSDNHAEVLLCMLGIMRAGAVWVPINYRNAADANVEYLNYSETRWLFYHSRFKEHVRELRARVPSLQHLICLDVADGDTAITRFARMARGEISGDAIERTRQQLLDYCRMDTLAMVRLHETLWELSMKR